MLKTHLCLVETVFFFLHTPPKIQKAVLQARLSLASCPLECIASPGAGQQRLGLANTSGLPQRCPKEACCAWQTYMDNPKMWTVFAVLIEREVDFRIRVVALHRSPLLRNRVRCLAYWCFPVHCCCIWE